MPVHYNSASRLLAHFEMLLRYSQGASTVDSWGHIFAIDEPDGYRKVFRVAERLCVLNDELERLEATLVADGSFEAELHAGPLQFARRAISPSVLHGNIDHAKSMISTEVRIPFRYMVAALPAEDREFDGDELADLLKLITQLQEVVSLSTLPAHIVEIVKSHIALLLRGIAHYPIQGPLALKQALKHMAAEYFANEAAVQGVRSSTEISLLAAILLKVQTMTASVSAASDYIAVGTFAYEVGKQLASSTT
jgi:hypothetical protein